MRGRSLSRGGVRDRELGGAAHRVCERGGVERVEVIGTATNGQDAVDLARALVPDVTLMDISMPVLDGIEAARRIRLELPDAGILILTGSSIAADVDRARQAGVAGFLTKDRIGTQLVGAILQVANR